MLCGQFNLFVCSLYLWNANNSIECVDVKTLLRNIGRLCVARERINLKNWNHYFDLQ